MPSNSVLKVLQFGLSIANRLCLISLKIEKQGNKYFVSHKKLENRTKNVWKIFILISYFITIIEIIHNLRHPKSSNLITLSFHVVLLIPKTAGVISVRVFYTKSIEFSALINSFCRNHNSIEKLPAHRKIKPRQNSFNIFLLVTTFTLLTLFALILPVFIYFLPCFYVAAANYLPFKCTELPFRSLILLIQEPDLLEMAATSYLVVSMCLVTLNEIIHELNELR